MHIRAYPWITQAHLSKLEVPEKEKPKQTLKAHSANCVAANRLAASCIAANCLAANRLAANCLIANCLAVLCFTAVFVCPRALANSSSTGSATAESPAMDRAAGNMSQTLKMAKFHTTRREFKEAIVLWTKLAESKPDSFAEANLGWSYLQLGEKQKAQKHINRSIQLNPRTIEGYRYLGYFLMGEGKVPDAVKAFRTSMSFDPHHKCNCGDLEKLVLSKSKNRKP